MIYGSIISLLVVILILATGDVPALAQLTSPTLTAIVVAAKFFVYVLVVFVLGRKKTVSAAGYSRLETRLNLLAIIVFAFDVYLLGLKHFLVALPLARALPTVMDLAGIAIFHLYLLVAWLRLRPLYARVFMVNPSFRDFVFSRLKFNLSLILPWILFSFLYDGLEYLPPGWPRTMLDSWWGGMIFFVAVFVVVAAAFPLLMVRLWNCRSVPPGETRRRLFAMAAKTGFTIRDICLWPLMEGRAVTAAVMGLLRQARFLLVTPALLENMDDEELLAVVAHEAGHVRYRHLWLYFLLFAGFAFISQALMPISVYWVMGTDIFYQMVRIANADPGEMLDFLGSVPLFLTLILYFRFVFGFFMRNFERQADLAALESLGSAGPLVTALEKIAVLGGNIRDKPNWHHFGIGERVDFLRRAEARPDMVRRHHRKVNLSLAFFVLMIVSGFFLYARAMPAVSLSESARFSEALISHRMRLEPDNPVWLQLYGDLLQDRGRYADAMRVYGHALAIDPDNGEILNNMAWLLLTARVPWQRDSKRALTLAKKAVSLHRRGYVLDTLALAYWRNGMAREAQRCEREAMELDPGGSLYYQGRIAAFGGYEE